MVMLHCYRGDGQCAAGRGCGLRTSRDDDERGAAGRRHRGWPRRRVPFRNVTGTQDAYISAGDRAQLPVIGAGGDAGDVETEAALERLVSDLGPDPRAWGGAWGGALLAESRWEAAGDAPDDAAGDIPASGDFLLRVGPAYVLYRTDGGDWEWDDLYAADDSGALAQFRAHQGE